MNVLKKPWFMLILLIPFLRPAIMMHLPSPIGSIFNYWRLAAVCIALILFFLYGKLNRFIVAVVIYLVILLYSNIHNNGDLFTFFDFAGSVIGISLIMNLFILASPDVIKVLLRLLTVIFVSNFLMIIFYGTYVTVGSARVFFFGHQNAITTVMILMILVCAVYTHMTTNRFSALSLILFGCIGISILAIWSATGVAAFFILLTCILLIHKSIFRLFFNFKILFPINIGLFFFIVIFRMQEYFAFIIEDLLDRSLTFTGRTLIWDDVVIAITHSPLIGYGVGTMADIVRIRGGEDAFWIAHNVFFEILLRGGFLALFVYVIFVIFVGKVLVKHKKHPISSLFAAGIFVFFIAGLTESYFYNMPLFIILTLAFHVDKIIVACKSYEEESVAEQYQSKYIISRTRGKLIYNQKRKHLPDTSLILR